MAQEYMVKSLGFMTSYVFLGRVWTKDGTRVRILKRGEKPPPRPNTLGVGLQHMWEDAVTEEQLRFLKETGCLEVEPIKDGGER